METKKPGTDIVLYQQPLLPQEADHGPQTPPDAEFVEVDARVLPPGDDGNAGGGDSEPREPRQEPEHDNARESASEQHLRDIAAGIAFLVDAKMREERAAAAEPTIPDEPAPDDEPDAPEPPDMSGVEDKLDRVGDILEHIAAQNTPPTPPPAPPRPPSYLSLGAAEIDARKDPNPELTEALDQLSKTESMMARLDIGQDNENPYPGQASYYDTKLSVESKSYVDVLTRAAVQNNVEEVKIGLQGMRLIKRSLEGDIAPTPDTLTGLSRIIEQQIDSSRISPDNPLVKEVTERLKVENWRLSDDEVQMLEGIVSLDRIAGPVKIEPPKQGLYERFKRGSSRHVKSQSVPNMSPEGVLSQRVESWWKQSNERHRVPKAMTMGTKQILQDHKLALTRQDAMRRLELHQIAASAA